MKRKILLAMSTVMLIVTLITTILVAFLLDNIIKEKKATIGEVNVGYDIYFTKGTENIKASEVFINPEMGIKKSGVYFVNLDNINSNEYISYLNVDIIIKSNIDTYVRVKVIEQLTLTIINYNEEKTEISIISPNTEFDLYDDNEEDGQVLWFYDGATDYYYLTTPIKGKLQDNQIEEETIKFIIPFKESYSPRPLNYSLQIGFEIDAVQTKGGPQNNWNLDNQPWGGNWQ